MPPEQRSVATRHLALALAPGILAVASLVFGSVRNGELFSNGHYLLNAALFVAAGLGLLFAAFLARRAGRARTARGALVGGALVALLGLSDGYLVLFGYDSSGPGGILCFTHRNWYDRYVHDNADGFWEDELEPIRQRGPGGPLTIAVVGDSFTWAQGLRGRELRFTDLLQANLRAAGKDCRVLNFGVGGTGTARQIKEIMPAVRSVRPDLVIVGYLTNDIDDRVGLARIEYPTFSRAALEVMSLTPTINHVYYHYLAPATYARVSERVFFGLLGAYRDPANMAEHLGVVRELLGAAREGGTPVLFVNMPFPHLWSVTQPHQREQIVGQLLAAAKECGALTSDLAAIESEFPPGRFEMNPLDGHPNAAVHGAIERALRETILAHPELLAGRGSAPLAPR